MDINKYFESLKLDEWILIGNQNGGGQSSTVHVKNIRTNARGVFRVLKNPEEIDIKRFKRELKILINPEFAHSNIVEILDYSKAETEYWYISKLGEVFETHWKKIEKKWEDNPNELCKIAIEYCTMLLEGLTVLHKQKVIHRDIKPKNIIVDNESLKLIDFGLLFIDGEERLSPLNEAVGNARFSHDTQMNRLEEVPAWLDVFQISQLFIWMLQEQPDKSWTRPLHWAYVIYPYKMSIENILKLKAITSVCSDPVLSPKDAGEMLYLIRKLFVIEKVGIMNKNISEIKEIVALKTAKNILESNGNHQILTSTFNLFLSVYQQLYNYIVEFSKTQNCKDMNGSIIKYPISTIQEALKGKSHEGMQTLTLLQLYFGDTSNGKNFYIYLDAYIIAPAILENNQNGFYKDNLPWGFGLIKNAVRDEGQRFFGENGLDKNLQYRLNGKGDIISLSNSELVNIEDVVKIVDELIFNKQSFEIL